jgi:hypothetical protein
MNSTKGAAKRSDMGELHDALARKLTDVIKNGEPTIRGGEEIRVPVTAAMLNVVVRFLKDNNVECDEGLATRPIGELSDTVTEALKKMEEDEDLPVFTN